MQALKKIKVRLDRNQFLVIINALEWYQKYLSYHVVPKLDSNVQEIKAVTSIVFHLVSSYNTRYNDTYATLKPKLNELYHHALIIREALIYYQNQTDNKVTAGVCRTIYEVLDLQIKDIELLVID